MMIKVHFNHNY